MRTSRSSRRARVDQLSPLAPQPEPTNLLALKAEIARRWPITSLFDVLKETDVRVGLTQCFRSPTAWKIWTARPSNTACS